MSRDGAESFVEHNECEANKAKLKSSLKWTESKLFNSQQRLQEIELTKDTIGQLASKIDEPKKAFGASEK